jgi:HK97 family phage portal protein
MSKPSLLHRAKLAWRVFNQGIPWGSMVKAAGSSAGGGAALSWDTNPVWHTSDYQSYAEEGFGKNSIIYSAIMYKVRSKMSAPLAAYTGDINNPEPAEADHPLQMLVSRPNPYQSSVQFHALNEIYFNLGNSYVLFKRPLKGGLPEAMYALRPDRVFIIPDKGAGDDQIVRGIKGYLYVPEGKTMRHGVPILPEDMMHTKLPNALDPMEGMGYGMPPMCIAQSTDVDNDVTRFLKLFFQNGAIPPAVLTFTTPLDDEVVDQVRERWMQLYGGVDNWTEIGVLDRGGSYQRVGMNFNEMGFEALDERNESRILGPLGVPPILIGTRVGLQRSTYSNYREARLAYWEDTAIPEQTLFEKGYQYYLQSEDDAFVMFDRTRVPALQKDMPKLVGAAYVLWKMGATANQAVRAVGLSIRDIPGGDISYIPTGLLPAGAMPEEEDRDQEGAPSAEDETRKRGVKHQAARIELPCPICGAKEVDSYADHGGLCVCPDCHCTFDPSVKRRRKLPNER